MKSKISTFYERIMLSRKMRLLKKEFEKKIIYENQGGKNHEVYPSDIPI